MGIETMSINKYQSVGKLYKQLDFMAYTLLILH